MKPISLALAAAALFAASTVSAMAEPTIPSGDFNEPTTSMVAGEPSIPPTLLASIASKLQAAGYEVDPNDPASVYAAWDHHQASMTEESVMEENTSPSGVTTTTTTHARQDVEAVSEAEQARLAAEAAAAARTTANDVGESLGADITNHGERVNIALGGQVEGSTYNAPVPEGISDVRAQLEHLQRMMEMQLETAYLKEYGMRPLN